MNIKNNVTLSDQHLQYAERLVESGQFPSVEKVVEAGLDKLMHGEKLKPEHDVAMADLIRERMDTPRDQFIPWDGDSMAERIKAKLDAKYGESKKVSR